MAIHETVRLARQELKLSQAKFAHTLDMDQGHLSRFERGLSGVSSFRLEEILHALDLEVQRKDMASTVAATTDAV